MLSASRLARRVDGGGQYGRIVEQLGRDIVAGGIPVGTILRVEQLCERYAVSRSVMREAVRTLGSMGLIESRQQVGTRVLPQSEWELLNPRIVAWRGRGPEYLAQHRELLELRLGIEPAAAQLAASRMSDSERQRMVELAEHMAAAEADGEFEAFFAADVEFHELLLSGSGNAVLAQLSDTVTAVLESRAKDHRPGMRVISAPSVERHRGLALALQAGDEEGARRWAREVVAITLDEFAETPTPSSRPR